MERNSKHEALIGAIKTHHEKTGGKCGLPYVKLLIATGLKQIEAKPLLEELRKAKEIHGRQGLNDILFFYGTRKM